MDRGRMKIEAIVMAAGVSQRMGCPKMTLPWGKTTVIGKVVATLAQAGKDGLLEGILVITGGARGEVEATIEQIDLPLPVRMVFNPRFAVGEMLSSLQVGLESLGKDIRAALVTLGDQPQIESNVVRAILKSYRQSRTRLVVPSYQRRRGHPWIVDRALWPEIQALKPPCTLRDFLNTNESHINYLPVDTPAILQDLDTPGDYMREKP